MFGVREREATDALTLVLAGDLVLDEPDPDYWLAGIAPALHAADVAIGHLEVPHTHAHDELPGDVPAPGADPVHVPAIARAGFDMVSLAGNHMADCGATGIADTIAALDAVGIAHAGAGTDLGAARAHVVIERGGWRIALLSYNCVGPENGWATAERAGFAYLPISTLSGRPVAPAEPLGAVLPEAHSILKDDVAKARAEADVVIVALHKGIVHTPAILASYEREIAQASIDAGADVVASHHAHIVRGIEIYRGKPIFHGLGNACVVTRALSPGQDHPARAAWVERRKKLFGFEPDPAFTLAPFHPEAVNAMLGQVTFTRDGDATLAIIPVDVVAPGRPMLARGARAQEIGEYINRIGLVAGLPPLSAPLNIFEGGEA